MGYISERDLHNDTNAVLRRVESGERLRVTVSGRPVAELVPLPRRRTALPWAEFERDIERVRADRGLTAHLRELVPDTTADAPRPGQV